MLSVDNLFVFRSIFLVFRTPENQKHKPLFWGIMGAVFFRMLFFVVGEILLHSFSIVHLVLGAFLVYTGFKVVLMDEEEAPDQGPVITKITQLVPYVDAYAPTPLFFARLEPYDPMLSARGEGQQGRPQNRRSSISDFSQVQPLRATRLLIVVIALELTDVVFAVDSVSAIVAQVPDLFLAYTACVFAMLGLRATFFVIDELVKVFSLLSYAVGAILVFIGAKLCLRGWVHVPQEIVCCILVSAVVLSMVASVIFDRCRG